MAKRPAVKTLSRSLDGEFPAMDCVRSSNGFMVGGWVEGMKRSERFAGEIAPLVVDDARTAGPFAPHR